MRSPDSTSAQHQLVDAVAAELTAGIDRAVSFWINQIDDVLQDTQLTTLGRLQAVKELIGTYRHRSAGIAMTNHGNVA